MGVPHGTMRGRTHVCGPRRTGAPGEAPVEDCWVRGSTEISTNHKCFSKAGDGGSHMPWKITMRFIYTLEEPFTVRYLVFTTVLLEPRKLRSIEGSDMP